MKPISTMALAVVASLAPVIASTTPAVAQDAPKEYNFQCGTLGSVAYSIGNAMQELFAENPSIRIINAEGAGATAATINLINNPAWKSAIGCTTAIDYAYAKLGVAPFYNEPVDIDSDVKVLFNYLYAAVGFVTTDSSLSAVADLNGKTIGAGRRGQANWGGIPALMLEKGLPETNVNFEFLGPDPAHEAVADGRLMATATQIPISPDGSKAFTPGIVNKLLASRGEVYALSFTEDQFKRAREAGVPFQSISIAPEVLPFKSQGPVTWVYSPGMITVSKEFPEDAAYEIVKTMLTHASELPEYQALFEVIASPERLLGRTDPANLHPGAAKAFREAGLLQ